ncbi:MAG TPA: hypothetical protein VKT82_17080 [Ktedonobacterales bacterium]|nr:hypothetical protein [Ktedonobacterales bacterium]
MSEQITTDAARVLLAASIKHAEQSLLRLIASGQLKHSVAADPYTALVALATAAAAIIEGGTVEVALSDLQQVMDFIATDPAYTPDPRFPFDKAQFAAALNKEA